MAESTAQEMREYPRLEERRPLVYEILESLETGTSYAKNISGGGLCFETETRVSPGDGVRIQIYESVGDRLLGIRAPAYAVAKVVWTDQIGTSKYQSGLRFVDIEEKCRDRIIKSVEKKLSCHPAREAVVSVSR
jgi:hypothetical protein